MKKNIKIGALGLGFIVALVVTICLCNKEIYTYAMISGAVSAICLALGIMSVVSIVKNEDAFTKNLNRVLKAYDAILVRSNNIPDLKNKNIIKVETMEDLVDAQIGIRKPIYYKKQVESCSFVLLDQDNALIHIMKQNDDVTSPLEIVLKDIEREKKKKEEEDIDYSILKEIEKTTILKLENNKSYRISPVRKSVEAEDVEII